MINRAALILKYKEPAIKWLNINPSDDEPDITEEEANDDQTIYLITEEDAESPEALKKRVKLNYQNLFETELEGWCTDEELWPKKRTFTLFEKWFSCEVHSVVVDTVEGAIIDEDEDEDDTYH